MKKLIFTILLALFCFDFMQAKKVFVEMEYSNNTIKLDDGSNKKSQAIKDQNGNDILKSASNLNGNLNCSKELEHYAS